MLYLNCTILYQLYLNYSTYIIIKYYNEIIDILQKLIYHNIPIKLIKEKKEKIKTKIKM